MLGVLSTAFYTSAKNQLDIISDDEHSCRNRQEETHAKAKMIKPKCFQQYYLAKLIFFYRESREVKFGLSRDVYLSNYDQ